MSKKWYSVGISDTEEILKTNAACGLSHKAARSRVRKDGKNDFFYVKSKPMLSVLKPLISDPILILLVGVDIIAALFGKELTAVVVGTIILIHIVSLFLIYRLSCQRVTEISSSCRPKARVIRDGKLFITDSENLVRGDVILLEKGDIVPCDARMVSGNNLKVNIFAGRNSERQYVVAEPDKDAQYPADASKNFWEFRNMLYAGSVVVSGNARGIVVETGKRTYIGVLDGGIPLNDGSEHPKTLSELKSFSKIYCLLMLVAILPLTIAGIFSYGFDNIMSTFLLSVSVLISALGDLIYIIGNIITASILFKCATSEKSSALIKSAERIDTLAEIDELVLIGDSAFTDKNLRVSRAVANGKEYKGKEILDKSLIYPAELVLLMMRALNSYPSGSVLCDIDIPNSFNDYAQKLGVDASGFDVRFSLRGISFGEVTSLGVSDGNSSYELCLSRTDKLLHLCSYERVVGENMVISSSRREEIGKFFSYFASQGFLVYTVAKCINGAYVLCGIFVIKKGTSIEARRAFANLESL